MEEMYNKIKSNRNDGTLVLKGTSIDMVESFRRCRRRKEELHGVFRIEPTNRTLGLLVRKAAMTDGMSMYRTFEPFTADATKTRLMRPLYDTDRNALVATDGVAMLFCDIPEGFTAERAKEGFFSLDSDSYPNWLNVLGMCTRETTPHHLRDFDRLGEFSKGDDLHNILSITASCSIAYRHADKKGRYRNLYMWIGGNQYDPVYVKDIADSLFRLGCDRIGFYYPKFGYSYKPLHIVGFGNGLNSRGLLMPTRFSSKEVGAVELPLKTNEAAAAA